MARPCFTCYQKTILLTKLEPYLRSGLPLYKACVEAHVPRSTVYYFMDKEQWFLDKIRLFEQYISVLLNTILFNELLLIVHKQNVGESLEHRDIKFLQWFSRHSVLTGEEYGRRKYISTYDPELETHRVNKLLGISI